MLDTAWAIELEPENYQAILSEGGRQINREFLETWLEKYPDSPAYFVRDTERKKFDCTIMAADDFWVLYRRIEGRTTCDPKTLNDGLVDCNGAHYFPIETDEAPDHVRFFGA